MGGYHAPAMRIAGALLLSLGSIGSMALAPAMHATLPVEVVPNSKRQRQGDGRSDFKGRRLRSRGPQARPKRKTNRVRLSRRTRRKHRRAA